MNIRTYLSATVLLAANTAGFNVLAQDETDALRYSYLSPQATARSMGFAGAVGALGGDFTSLSVNPAGIGVYRRSEFTFTPSLKINGTKSTYQNTETNDNTTRFTINNLGVVFTSAAEGQRYERSKWKSVSFGVGINRIADFSRNYTYNGSITPWQGPGDNDLTHNSASEIFSIDANNNATPTTANQMPTNSRGYLGYQSYLLDTLGGAFVPVTIYSSKLNQQKVVQERGGITDIAISLGANYMEKLMLGATVGIPSIIYKRDITFTESDASGVPNNFFNNYQYTESLVTRGTGVNLKLGAIYKPVDFLRLGLAVHTPTYYSMKDVQDMTLTANTENFKYVLGSQDTNPITKAVADQSVFQYNMVTPWRMVASAAAIIGKYGFISADYEYVDYSSTRFKYDGIYKDQQTALNQVIKNTYKGASILRVGVEGRIDIVSIRLGFGYYGSPYKNNSTNGQSMNVTAGVGFRLDNWFVDFGVMHTMVQDQEYPYALNYGTISPVIPTATIKSSMNNAALTVGVKF
ncbi:MAG: hypothetical protein JST70_10915 [Bacteroidetes bacterium]|nr:hypothetical protein [Bacteroidota bacterium]